MVIEAQRRARTLGVGSVLLTLWGAALGALPAAAEGSRGFERVGEGLTSADELAGLDAGYRRFTAPDMAETCDVPWPERIEVRSVPTVTAGAWFDYAGFSVLALDRDGRVIPRVPIGLEIDAGSPPVLAMETSHWLAVRDGLKAIRPGVFRLRVATQCAQEGRAPLSATAEIPVGPACPAEFAEHVRKLQALTPAVSAQSPERRAVADFFAALPSDYFCFDRLFGDPGGAAPLRAEPKLSALLPRIARAVPVREYAAKLVALSVQARRETAQAQALQTAARALLDEHTEAFVAALGSVDGEHEWTVWTFLFAGPAESRAPLDPSVQTKVCAASELSCSLSKQAFPVATARGDRP